MSKQAPRGVEVADFHLQVRRASHTAPIPDTTSQLCGRTPASGGPPGPSTVRKERVNTCPASELVLAGYQS